MPPVVGGDDVGAALSSTASSASFVERGMINNYDDAFPRCQTAFGDMMRVVAWQVTICGSIVH